MSEHKYACGDMVSLGSRMHSVPDGPFKVIRCLPSDGADHAYRVRCVTEAFDRIVQERQIEGLATTSKSGADALFSL